MALNFTVSYTFSPSTTISSSQVNTNTSDVANVFTGLEAETKTLAKLKVDIDPTLALEVATKQYVDHYSTYRRPVLKYASGSIVNIETGVNGTSGQAQILFPDGNLRTDSTTARINCNLAQVAALSGTAQSGLRTGTVAANTSYALYAVKTSDNASNFVAVADTVLPLQANFATLNSNFGTGSWVYLGLIFYGDNSTNTTTIMGFHQAGNVTMFNDGVTGNVTTLCGPRLATSAGATSVTYTYATGTSTPNLPANITLVIYHCAAAAGVSGGTTFKEASTQVLFQGPGTFPIIAKVHHVAGVNISVNNGSSVAMDINIAGFVDGVLGVGSNPIL